MYQASSGFANVNSFKLHNNSTSSYVLLTDPFIDDESKTEQMGNEMP